MESHHLCFFFIFGSILHLSLGVLPPNFLEGVHRKFEFKYSFKPPFVVNSKGEIPFWSHGGDALPTENQIRVCPSIQDRRGWVWTKNIFEHQFWMFDVSFSIFGKHSYGADGMAFWFTAQKGIEGPMFGNTETYDGLSVVIDTFDNNAKGDSPKIAVFINNGTLYYDHSSDGHRQDVASCVREVRNKKHPTHMKVVFYGNILEVWIHEGASKLLDDYDLCIKLDRVVNIPTKGYFGISAATGGLSDDHDVTSFVTHSLIPKEEQREKMIEKMDQLKAAELEKEYQQLSTKFETKREQHTKDQQAEIMDWQRTIELEENIRQIHNTQGSLSRDVRGLNSKMDHLLRSIEGNIGGGGVSDNTVLAAEGRLSHQLTELKSQLDRSVSGSTGGKPVSEQMQPVYALQENINHLIKIVDKLQEEIQKSNGNRCPDVTTPTSCLSTGFFVFVILLQSIGAVVFLVYKYNQERNAKKFF